VDRLLAGEWKEFETARDILKRPYCRTFIYDHEADKYSAFILEFPGCVAEGFSIENANDLLVDAATSWILCMAANKNPIPDPFCKDDTRYGVTDLYKLWTVVEKWRADWPASSGDELARSVMEALGKISRPPTSATDPAP
jgi:predicted RNase H-like HicB family nuclease